MGVTSTNWKECIIIKIYLLTTKRSIMHLKSISYVTILQKIYKNKAYFSNFIFCSVLTINSLIYLNIERFLMHRTKKSILFLKLVQTK